MHDCSERTIDMDMDMDGAFHRFPERPFARINPTPRGLVDRTLREVVPLFACFERVLA